MSDWVLISLQLLGGLVFLVAGGELLVRGASAVASALGVSPLVIGLTVVAFGTSAPELAVSLGAGLTGNPDIAAGNVVGSNIFNVLVILGVCALILPLAVSRQLIRREVPLMIGASVLMWLLARDGKISTLDGVVLFSGLVVFIIWSIFESRKESARASGDGESLTPAPAAPSRWWPAAGLVAATLAGAGYTLGWLEPVIAGLLGGGALGVVGGSLLGRQRRSKAVEMLMQAGLIAGGLGVLVFGADNLVNGATAVARAFQVSDLIIGLTIVAVGTSLPEVATSTIATLRNQRDIAIGNVVGSNLFNILGILGLSAIITPGGLNVNPLVVSFDLPIMIAVAVVCLPIFFTNLTIARWEGVLFLGSYVAYTAFLTLAAARNPALETFANAMRLILPLVVVVLGWSVIQALRQGRAHRYAQRGRGSSSYLDIDGSDKGDDTV